MSGSLAPTKIATISSQYIVSKSAVALPEALEILYVLYSTYHTLLMQEIVSQGDNVYRSSPVLIYATA